MPQDSKAGEHLKSKVDTVSFPNLRTKRFFLFALFPKQKKFGRHERNSLEHSNHSQPITNQTRAIATKQNNRNDRPLAAYIIASSGKRMS